MQLKLKCPSWTGFVPIMTIASALLTCCLASTTSAAAYSTSGNTILKDGSSYEWRGVNAMHEYGVGSSDMNPWGIDIVRETIHDMQNQPLSGGAVYVDGAWRHSLQNMVNDNRANGKVTILCPFDWNGSGTTMFLGKNPSQTTWWEAYKTRYRAIANQFKNQPDVWFDVWNEPYSWDDNNLNGYTENLWLSDMQAMVDNIRSTGATNIILVPGSHMGQKEGVIINKGPVLLTGRSNIVFGVHAYERWLYDTQAQVESRIQAVLNAGCPLIFGEFSAKNNDVMPVQNFLNACRSKKISALAWLWKYSDSEQGALLRANGTPNDVNNYTYGSTVLGYTQEQRNFGTGLRGDYYSGQNFNSHVKSQVDSTVNFNWGSSSGPTSVGIDNFSIRWTGEIQAIETGTYTISTTSDDGARLWVNNQLLVDKWVGQAATTWGGTVTLTAGQKYPVKFEYYEGGGGASAILKWQRPGQTTAEVVPQMQLYPTPIVPSGNGSGITARYYSGQNFNMLIQSRIDPAINFNWGSGSPMSSVGPDSFSIRWTGYLQARDAGAYTFTTTTDDGVRLWIGDLSGTPLIDKWMTQSATPWSTTVNLTAGQKVAIKMEYLDVAGNALAKLEWMPPGQTALQIVPQSQLFPD